VNDAYSITEEMSVCSGDDYTFPDGTIETNITTSTSHISNLFSQVTGCDSIVSTNIAVIEPIVILSEVEVCSGDDYTFPDGTTETNIIANTSHISNFVSQVTGCDSIITINITVSDIINSTEEVSICSGENYTYPDGTTESNITSNTTHESLINVANGCDSLITTNITVNTVNVNVTVNGNMLTADNTTADSYQWLNCGTDLPVNGETNYTFTAIETGDYAVAIMEENCVDTSSCNSITVTAIEEVENLVYSIWPNPTSGQINIRLIENNTPIEIYIFNVLGKIVLQKEVAINETDFNTNLPGKNGVYFIQIKSNSNTATYKIIKK
jgi:hypothetical protein